MRAWYPRYPGDYARDTQDLDSLELHGAYTLLLDHYYMTQRPIPNDRFLVGKILRISPQKAHKILQTLSKYFEAGIYENRPVFYHYRVECEIDKSLSINSKLSKAGRAGGLAKARAESLAKAIARPQPTITVHSNINDSAHPSSYIAPNQDAETDMPYTPQNVVDLYNKMLPGLIPIKKLTRNLEKDIRTIHNTESIGCPKIEHWENFFKRVARSDWLTGRAQNKPSRYSLRKLVEIETFTKIAEGNYD